MKKISNLLNEDKNKIKALLILCFILVFIMNLLVVPTSDDYGYSINNGFLDIFHKEYIQYFTWSGRSVAHIIARLFLAMPKIVFNIFNSICYVFVNYMVYLHAKGNRKIDKPSLLAVVMLIIFLFIPFFGQTVLWETGSCNYLWMIAIILTFLSFYRFYLNDQVSSNRFLWIIMLFLGILAGWSNENTGGAVLLIIIFFVAYQLIKKIKIHLWQIMGFVGCLTGFLFLVMAPGNQYRIEDVESMTQVATSGIVYKFVHSINNLLNILSKNPGWIYIICALVIVVILTWKKHNYKSLTISLCYFISGLGAVVAMLLTPNAINYDRSMFGGTIFAIISLCIMINELDLSVSFNKLLLQCLIGVLCVTASFQYVYAGIDLLYINHQYKQREAYVATQKANGNLNPVVFQYNQEFVTSYNPIKGLNDIDGYSGFWLNKNYSITHNLESIESTPLWQWEKIYQMGDSKLMNINDIDEYLEEIKNNDNYIILVTCSSLNKDYLELYASSLKKVNIVIDDSVSNFVAVLHNGEDYIKTDDTGMEYYGTIDNKELYLASYSEPSLCDITIDGIDYTNDQPGISIVVFDKINYRVIDSVRWDDSFGKASGVRFSLDK